MKKQSGFAVLEIVLVLVVVAVLGFTAFTYFNNRQAGNEAATANVAAAPQITSTADLTTAETALDQLDIDANTLDSAQLDAELNSF